MSTPVFASKLNRRHKAALCATLICVGLILLLSRTGFRPTIGILLLGLAFSWAFGSNYRLVHWVFVVFGVLLLIPAVGDGFSWDMPALVKSQKSLVDSDREVIKSEAALIADETDRVERRKREGELSKYSEELSKDEQELQVMERGKFPYIIKNDWATIVPGLLLLSAGAGLLVGIKPVHQNSV